MEAVEQMAAVVATRKILDEIFTMTSFL